MPLTFEFADTTPSELYEYKVGEEMHWHPRATSLIYYTMLLQFNLDGEMTNKKLIEIARRIALIDLFHTSPQYWIGDNGYRIQMADIVAYWGLHTNAGHKTKREWDAYYNRCFIERADEDFIARIRSTELKPCITK